MGSRKKTTLDEIAGRVGCSKSVVSRALNNKYGVSEVMKNRIYVAALELGYDFDQVYTASYKKGKSDVGYISIVLPTVSLLDDKFYGLMVRGIESVLNEQNINFCLNIVETMNHQEMVETLHRTKVSGVIVIGLVSYLNIAEIIYNGISVVLLDTLYNQLKVDRITVNNYSGAYEATEHLLKKGHQNLAFFGAVDFSPNFAERFRGMRECCDHWGGRVRYDRSVITPQDGERNVVANVREMIEVLKKPDRPTAVLCATDQIGFRLYEIAREQGLRLPEDLSVIGYGNHELCDWCSPRMTSVDIPKYLLGKEAAHMLLKRIRTPEEHPALVQLDAALFERESVADVKKG